MTAVDRLVLIFTDNLENGVDIPSFSFNVQHEFYFEDLGIVSLSAQRCLFVLIIGSWIGNQIVKVTGIKNMGRTTSVIVRGSNALVSRCTNPLLIVRLWNL